MFLLYFLIIYFFVVLRTSKTLLLFTVRDWNEETPQDVIKSQLGNDMKNIWKDISKVCFTCFVFIRLY